MRLFLALLMLSLSLASAAQTKFPVKVTHTGDDPVGTQYVYELREGIRASHGMKLVEKDYMEGHIKVMLVSLEHDRSDAAASSAIAIAIAYDSRFTPLGGAHLTLLVQNCGRNRVTSCAKLILAEIDRQASRLRDQDIDRWKTLFSQK